MTAANADLLLSLQYGDSFFPGGAVALSSGLETLTGEGIVHSRAQVEQFLVGQLQGRWSTFDRPVVAATHRASCDLREVALIDALVEAQTLAAESRDGSRRAGGALLGVHAKLGTPGSASYQEMVRDGRAIGHSAVVQGLVWGRAGMTRASSEATSAHGFSVGIVGAALRLGVLGHVGAQALLTRARTIVVGLLAEPCVPVDRLSAFTPEQEIAVMRHETASHRLFMN